MTIENFELKEFLTKDEETVRKYVTALNFIKPIDTKKEVFHMKLKHVEFIKRNLYSNEDSAIVEIVSKVQGVKVADVLEMKIIEFFGLVNSIKAQVERIAAAEENSLSGGSIDMKWIAVNGSERMARFGIYNTLERLSNGDRTKYKYFMNLEYSEVFTILLMIKTTDDLQKEMNKIKEPKKSD